MQLLSLFRLSTVPLAEEGVVPAPTAAPVGLQEDRRRHDQRYFRGEGAKPLDNKPGLLISL